MFWQLMRALRLPALYSYDELNETVLSFEPLDKIDVAASFRFAGLETQAAFEPSKPFRTQRTSKTRS
jgi:hypothetical protein